MRGLGRVESFLAGDYNRQAALELLQTSNKINYKFDNPNVVDANEALIAICAAEMQSSTQLERNKDPNNIPSIMTKIRKMHGEATRINVQTFIEAMPEAVELFKQGGHPDLAQDASDVGTYYADRYKALMQVKHLMMAPDAKTGFEEPDPLGNMH